MYRLTYRYDYIVDSGRLGYWYELGDASPAVDLYLLIRATILSTLFRLVHLFTQYAACVFFMCGPRLILRYKRLRDLDTPFKVHDISASLKAPFLAALSIAIYNVTCKFCIYRSIVPRYFDCQNFVSIPIAIDGVAIF